MKRPMPYPVCVLLIGYAWMSQSSAPTPNQATISQSSAVGSIEGRVTTPKGAAAKGASVLVASRVGRLQRRVTADVNGHYKCDGLPTGEYEVSATLDGFIRASYGSMGALPPRSVRLGAASRVLAIDIALAAGGQISGAVRDRSGEAMVGAHVTVLRPGLSGALRAVQSVDTAITNDSGQYRVYGLPAGSYFVVATVPRPASATVGYVPTYFPSASVPHDAAAVTVRDGGGSAEVNVVMLESLLGELHGIVLDQDGRPSSMPVSLRSPLSSGVPAAHMTKPDPTGHFTFRDVPAGHYVLEAHESSAFAGRDRPMSRAEVTVEGSGTKTVVVKPWRPVLIKGRLKLLQGPRPLSELEDLRVGGMLLNRDTDGGPLPFSKPGADMRFEFETWPGQVVPKVVSGTRWSLVAATLGGTDVMDDGFEVTGDPLGGLELTVTDRPAFLSGDISSSSSTALATTAVIAFPSEKARWGSGARCTLVRPDQNGGFVIPSIRPGSYFVVAVVDPESGCGDAAFLAHLAGNGVVVQIAAQSQNHVSLKALR